jgi:Rod binding domain-containing protein
MNPFRISDFGFRIEKARTFHDRDTGSREEGKTDRQENNPVHPVNPVHNPQSAIRNPQLLEASQQFEAFFVLQLWRAMKATVPNQSQSVNPIDLFDLPFAEHLSQGGNFQIGSLIYEQMSRYIQQGEDHENH